MQFIDSAGMSSVDSLFSYVSHGVVSTETSTESLNNQSRLATDGRAELETLFTYS